ncbi:AAA family ATPase [Caenimonas sp. SL110]|uniref:trifunctional serine/threonine-protein kinase/ATP-binding protein/sensor histidine kinase n=1 Tax=Caenimonas sp. SL110 TaxID=1450524 RepID=UPI0013792F50|nr:AAA family ATPase [Caenimonas sp. SL110]
MLTRLAGVAGVGQLVEAAGLEGTHDGEVVALCDGGSSTLAQLLRGGPLELAQLLTLAVRVVEIVAAMHRAGVIHRDINPSNIVLSESGEPMLIDFDLAVLAQPSQVVAQDASIVGTLAYLAPEQSGRTGRSVDQRADLYAIGVTLYEMACGRLPFEEQDTLQLVRDHLVREPRVPSQVNARVPAGLSNIILQLLAKSPEQRFQSAEGLLHDLLRLAQEFASDSGGSFALGERDFPARLDAPQDLVGRDAEIAALRTALTDAMHTSRHTVLIEGPAGVGKGALINTLRPTVTAAGGWMVYGKVDQYLKDGAAAGAMTQALRALGRLLLALPRSELVAQRQRILDSLGRNAAHVSRLLPEFALLLGPQDGMPEADPRQAETRLQQAIVDLLGAIASPQRPLVIVQDDLQWAAEQSFRVFGQLMGDARLRNVLFVGAYRGPELHRNPALQAMLAHWLQQSEPPLLIELGSLTQACTDELARRMLRLEPQAAHDLGQAVFPMTRGNPFDTVEMINALRREGVLSLREQGWHWDADAVRHFVSRTNVVDLLVSRLDSLPQASREVMEFLACLGNSVECARLSSATGLGRDELRALLAAPIEDGLLVGECNEIRHCVSFRHDRVQDAVISTMSDAQRSQRRLTMARRLAGEPAMESDAAQQYLACLEVLQSSGTDEERRRAAHLFHRFARKLASASKYSQAERYLCAAAGLLAAIANPADRTRRDAIDLARHVALYSLGRFDESDPLYAAMRERMTDPLSLVEPTCLQIRSLDMRGRMDDALALGLDLLAQLGLEVPHDFRTADRDQRLDALAQWVQQDSLLDQATRAQLQDPRLLAVAKLLGRVVGSAYLGSNLDAFACMLLEAQRLWEEHGPCAELVACMSHMNGMLIGLRQDYRCGYSIARHVLAVGEALGYEAQTLEARYRFAGHACAWFEPLETAFDHAMHAFEGLQARGDLSFACYGHIFAYNLLLDTAPTIDIHDAEIERGLALCRRTGNIHAAALHTCEQRFLRALRGQTHAPESFDDEHFTEEAFMASVGHLPFVDFDFFRALQAVLWGDGVALERYARLLMSRARGAAAGFFRVSHVHVFVALADAWQLQKAGGDPGDRARLVAQLQASCQWLAGRAADQPCNFLHLLRLVQAEQAWALGDLWTAAVTFDAAVMEAESRARPWHRALITERAALFQLTHGLTRTGRTLLADARDGYEAWGASAKVDQMQREHAFLRAPAQNLESRIGVTASQSGRSSKGSKGKGSKLNRGSDSVSSDELDLVGLLRASQALSSETSVEHLTTRVTEVLAALSGATKVLVLSWNEGQWWLLAPAPGEPSIPMAEASQQGLVPLSAIAYAERTGETLVVDDVAGDDRFARDPYFAGVALCSMLVVPIAGQGAARAVLILENRQGRGAFNPERLDAVMLIAGQLAVSLGNAQLYESLEQRVLARTRELEDMQAQLVATARRAGMAEIANNVLHNVGNVLNSINVSASVVRGTISNSRIGGLTRAVDLINQHQHDLAQFIETDPRGKALWPYLNELVSALRTERQDALGDLDRLSRSVEHIIYVVATQQSHAGPSSVLEMTQPEEPLEEAIHMCASALERVGVNISRDYQSVPVIALDRQRVLQILVNLIANATQAMEEVPPELRRLVLGVSMVRSETEAGSGRLCISVRDHGAGIAHEHLTRIFAHGFTTRRDGHGFGLHSSAVAALEMGGKLTVFSDGPGHGATFTLELPVA